MNPLKYLYYSLILLGFFILLFKSKNLLKPGNFLQLFIPIYISVIITEISFDVFAIYWPYHLNRLVECTSLFLYYFSILKNSAVKLFIKLAFVIFLLVYANCYILHTNNFFIYMNTDFLVESFFISLFSLLYLINLYDNDDIVFFTQNPHFWIVLGNLLFYSGCLFQIGFSKHLREHDKTLYSLIGYVNYILNLLLFSFYIKAFTCKSKSMKLQLL